MAFFYGAAVVALISCLATFAARGYALQRQLIDEPGDRRSHVVATPRGGGIGPVLVFALVLLLLIVLQPAAHAALWGTLGGFLAVAGVGFFDDHHPLAPFTRLCVHVIAGALLAWGFGLWASAPWLAVAVAGGVVVLVNVWNFMDGIDGIAASQALIVAACAALLLGPPWSAAAVGFAAACLGFLPANFPRARVFLGDVGSGAFGFALAALACACLVGPPAKVAQTVLLALPASAFLVDSGLTLARRLLRGERWWTAHTQHLFQVVARRFGHPKVTLAYAAASVIGGGVAWVNRDRPVAFTVALAVVWYIASAFMWLVLQHLARQGSDVCMEKDR